MTVIIIKTDNASFLFMCPFFIRYTVCIRNVCISDSRDQGDVII